MCYKKIKDKRNHKLSYRISVSIHNARDATYPKIGAVCFFVGELEPFDKIFIDYTEEIVFARSVYEPHLTEGVYISWHANINLWLKATKKRSNEIANII